LPTQSSPALMVVPETWIKMVTTSQVTKAGVIHLAGMQKINCFDLLVLTAQMIREMTK
jgi:hypothetical protein